MLCFNCMRKKGDATVCPHCGCEHIPAPKPHQLEAGTVIGGRYVVGKVLGEGGFGITYIGYDRTLDIRVAIKEFYPYGISYRVNTVSNTVSSSTQEQDDLFKKGKDRFLSEAKNVARFRNEHGIVTIFDFIEENNTAYIIMEYLDGIDLRHYLRQHGAIATHQTMNLLLPVIKSLEKMHAVGIIHRDISPDNLMVLKDGSVKLMDFGAAREYVGDGRSMSVMLKEGYAPEEQYRRNGKQGPWTDVYALCATFYRCITGKTPEASLDRIFEDPLKRPSELGVTITPAVENVLMYGMAVKQEDRCRSMDELYRLLTEALQNKPFDIPQKNRPRKTPADGKEDHTILADDAYTLSTTDSLSAGIRPHSFQTKQKKTTSQLPIIICIIAIVLAATVAFFLIFKPLSISQQSDPTDSVNATTVTGTTVYKAQLDDTADLLTSSEETNLSASLNDYSSLCSCNFMVATVDDLKSASFSYNGTTKDYADVYYEKTFGANTDGVLILIVLENNDKEREVYICTSGSCIQRLTESELSAVFDSAVNDHSPDSNGFFVFINDLVSKTKDALLDN